MTVRDHRSVSMRGLFQRQDIAGEVISLRNSLANHPQEMHRGSLREARTRLTQPASGDGFSRGCRRGEEIDFGGGGVSIPESWIPGADVAFALPSWVPVAGQTRLVREPSTGEVRLDADFAGETRTLEGVLTKSQVTHEDFPFKPWHTYYDWNFHVRVDPQYTYLKISSFIDDDGDLIGDVIECEWDTAFLPSWAWPQDGDRIWMVGRWIYDCGHPHQAHGHTTEIHPPKAVASFRTEAVALPGNTGSTQANSAKLYIGRKGGYWDQPINNQDYAFDLYLPPKPYAEAKPVSKVVPKEPQSRVPTLPKLPVEPQIAPFPADNPRALRVVIPLKGADPRVEEYGAIIYGGWSDPRNTEVTKIQRLRVTVEKILMDADMDWGEADEWYVYVGINGRWQVWRSLSGASKTLNYSVDLDLHPTDKIHIMVCGFEADQIHDLMGHNTGQSWADISDRSKAEENATKIRDGFLRLLDFDLSLQSAENEPLAHFSVTHPPHSLSQVVAGPGRQYRLVYRIDAR
jgi:hypothetical protein